MSALVVDVPRKEPVVVITRPFGQEYHVNLEWDAYESHVGVYFFKRQALSRGRRALKKKLQEYNQPNEFKITLTKLDLDTWRS